MTKIRSAQKETVCKINRNGYVDMDKQILYYLLPLYICYLFGFFLALPHLCNQRFRKRCIRKKRIVIGSLEKTNSEKTTYCYRIDGTLYSVNIENKKILDAGFAGKAPKNVTIYYDKPKGASILIEEFANFRQKKDYILFVIFAFLPILLYFIYLIFMK